MLLEKLFCLFVVYEVLKTDTIESLVIDLSSQDNIEDILPPLQSLWQILEEYSKNEKLISIGISDLDTEKFIQLFNWANVRANVSIIQLNC